MGRIGAFEIILVVLAIVLLFGIKRLPEIGSSLGKAIKEFRKAGKEIGGGSDTEQAKKNDVQSG